MPRIDPIQLLRCLSVLLSPNGGIRSTDEVKRLATLMLRFSKKLVSKCIYIQILKNTDTDVLGSFMGAGGWSLTLGWIDESIVAKNWALVQEILELLFLCPVDVERLKTNTFPKRVKGLSKEGNHQGVQFLASKLVERWLKVVKGEEVPPLVASQIPALPQFAEEVLISDIVSDLVEVHNETSITDEIENSSQYLSKQLSEELTDEVLDEMPDIESEVKNGLIPPLKICFRNGKQVVSKIESKYVNKDNKIADSEKQSSDSDLVEADEKLSDPSKSLSKSVKKSDKKSNSDKSHNSIKDKDSSKGRSSSSSRSSSSKSSSHSRSSSKSSENHRRDSDSKKDDKDSSKKHREKDRHRSSENKSKSSSSRDKSKDSRDNDKSKDITNKSKDSKDIIVKSSSPSISKLGKIPKKSSSSESNDKGEKKDKPSISIEVRKPNDPNRPKTVKMFHSKFRSHGLEEEARPPPPRGSVKKATSPVIQPSTTKRPSPTRSLDAPPEKKAKVVETIEKPGAIKLIPAKPKHDLQNQSAIHYWNSKPSMLIESRMKEWRFLLDTRCSTKSYRTSIK